MQMEWAEQEVNLIIEIKFILVWNGMHFWFFYSNKNQSWYKKSSSFCIICGFYEVSSFLHFNANSEEKSRFEVGTELNWVALRLTASLHVNDGQNPCFFVTDFLAEIRPENLADLISLLIYMSHNRQVSTPFVLKHLFLCFQFNIPIIFREHGCFFQHFSLAPLFKYLRISSSTG